MNEILIVKSKKDKKLNDTHIKRELFNVNKFEVHGFKIFDYVRKNIEYSNVKNTALIGDEFYFYKGIVTTDYEEEISLNVEEFTDYFHKKPQELEGFYSFIKIDKEKLISFKNGTNVYLTWVYDDDDYFCISTDFNILTEYLTEVLNIELKINELFFGNLNLYLQNMTYCGGPYQKLKNIDSLYRMEYANESNKMDLIIYDNLYDEKLDKLYKLDKDLFWDKIADSSQKTLKKIFSVLNKEDITSQITGGRDSRLNLAYILNSFSSDKIKLKTRGKEWNNDLILGKEISKFFNIEHEIMALADFSYSKLDYIDLLKTYKTGGFMRTFAVGFSMSDSTKQEYRHQIELNGLLGNIVTGDKSGLGKYALPFSDAVDEDMRSILKSEKIKIINKIEETINIKNKYQYYFTINFNKHNTITFDSNSKIIFPISIFALDILSRASIIIPYKNNGEGELHYELMRRLEKALVSILPFETGKSFSNFESYEIEKLGMDYRIAMPNGKFLFLDINKGEILRRLETIKTGVINQKKLKEMKERELTPNDKRILLSWLGYAVNTNQIDSKFGVLNISDPDFDDIQNKELIDMKIGDDIKYFNKLDIVNFAKEIIFEITDFENVNKIIIQGTKEGEILPVVEEKEGIKVVRIEVSKTQKINIKIIVGEEKFVKQKQIYAIMDNLNFHKVEELRTYNFREDKLINLKKENIYNLDFSSTVFYKTFLFNGLKDNVYTPKTYIIIKKDLFRKLIIKEEKYTIKLAPCMDYYILQLSNYKKGFNKLSFKYNMSWYTMEFNYLEEKL